MKRRELIVMLQNLLTDEYDPKDWVDKSKAEIVRGIYNAGEYYRDELNN